MARRAKGHAVERLASPPITTDAEIEAAAKRVKRERAEACTQALAALLQERGCTLSIQVQLPNGAQAPIQAVLALPVAVVVVVNQ